MTASCCLRLLLMLCLLANSVIAAVAQAEMAGAEMMGAWGMDKPVGVLNSVPVNTAQQTTPAAPAAMKTASNPLTPAQAMQGHCHNATGDQPLALPHAEHARQDAPSQKAQKTQKNATEQVASPDHGAHVACCAAGEHGAGHDHASALTGGHACHCPAPAMPALMMVFLPRALVLSPPLWLSPAYSPQPRALLLRPPIA